VPSIPARSCRRTRDGAKVEVDAYPGETFQGRIARVAPVLDPATRTAPIEIEIPNPDFRLKPGMYARVGITTAVKKDTLVVPVNAVADLGGRRGVFQHVNGVAIFRTVELGTEVEELIEVLGGLSEGDQVITTGARALRDGDRIQLAGAGGADGGRRGGRRGEGGGGSPAAREGGARDGGGRAGGTPTREGGASSGRPSGDGSSRRSGSDGSGRRGDGSGRYGDGSGRRSGGDGTQRPPSGQRQGSSGSSQ
jgi:membrane fusion protein (multidrug efflux system)